MENYSNPQSREFPAQGSHREEEGEGVAGVLQ